MSPKTSPLRPESAPGASALVYVVDDDTGVLDAIRMLLGSVGLASRGFSSATEFLEAFDPDVHACIILDLRMPGMSGLELQARLRESGSVTPIIFVTAHGDVPSAVEAVKGGAVDFIQKPFQDQKLLDKVHQALAQDAALRAERRRKAEILAKIRQLTPREAEVMALVVQGKMNKSIARELGISQRTVEIHRARVMEKVGARSVQELVQIILSVEGLS